MMVTGDRTSWMIPPGRAVLIPPSTPHSDGVTATALARRCGLSTRTLERLFRADTGMPFGLWRQK